MFSQINMIIESKFWVIFQYKSSEKAKWLFIKQILIFSMLLDKHNQDYIIVETAIYRVSLTCQFFRRDKSRLYMRAFWLIPIRLG